MQPQERSWKFQEVRRPSVGRRGRKKSRRKNKPTEPQLFVHLSHTSVSPVSTLVWLARGLAKSLPTLLPLPMAQDQKCFLLSLSSKEGPWPSLPGRTHHIWKRTIYLSKFAAGFFFFFLNMKKLFRHRDLNKPVWHPWIVLNHWVPPAFRPTLVPQICLPLLHVKQPSSKDVFLFYISLAISLSIYIYIFVYPIYT